MYDETYSVDVYVCTSMGLCTFSKCVRARVHVVSIKFGTPRSTVPVQVIMPETLNLRWGHTHSVVYLENTVKVDIGVLCIECHNVCSLSVAMTTKATQRDMFRYTESTP